MKNFCPLKKCMNHIHLQQQINALSSPVLTASQATEIWISGHNLLLTQHKLTKNPFHTKYSQPYCKAPSILVGFLLLLLPLPKNQTNEEMAVIYGWRSAFVILAFNPLNPLWSAFHHVCFLTNYFWVKNKKPSVEPCVSHFLCKELIFEKLESLLILVYF